MSNQKLSENEKRILHDIFIAVEARVRNGSLQGGLTAEGVNFTIFYMLKREQ